MLKSVFMWLNVHPIITLSGIFGISFAIGRIVDRCECGSLRGYDSTPIGYYHVYHCRKCGKEKKFK